MQAIKEKFNDMKAMRQAKAEAKEEEKAKVQAAHEIRMAKEAEAEMDLHVNKAVGKVEEKERRDGSAMTEPSNPGYSSSSAGNSSSTAATHKSQ